MLTKNNDTQAQVRANEERVGDLVAEAGPELRESIERTTQALTRLAATVAAHSRADTSIGILADVMAQAPRLEAEAKRLERDHLYMPTALLELRMRSKELQIDIEAALARLDEHQRLVQHLVYEAFSTDLGTGD